MEYTRAEVAMVLNKKVKIIFYKSVCAPLGAQSLAERMNYLFVNRVTYSKLRDKNIQILYEMAGCDYMRWRWNYSMCCKIQINHNLIARMYQGYLTEISIGNSRYKYHNMSGPATINYYGLYGGVIIKYMVFDGYIMGGPGKIEYDNATLKLKTLRYRQKISRISIFATSGYTRDEYKFRADCVFVEKYVYSNDPVCTRIIPTKQILYNESIPNCEEFLKKHNLNVLHSLR